VANAKAPGEAFATAFRTMCGCERIVGQKLVDKTTTAIVRPARFLLEGHIAVGRDQYLEAGSFSDVEKAAIG
jgi:hypothetical protein